MGSGIRNLADSDLLSTWSADLQLETKFVRVAQLRRLKSCQQVAAVCYRVREDKIEFLLVQTRSGRWTFPKGSAERGLTHAQAAALEAFEEAGVHGRIEEAAFTKYLRRKNRKAKQSGEISVSAHLCEVSRLDPPQEPHRRPTWFTSDRAKLSLRENRGPDGAELARVVHRALVRIQQLHGEVTWSPPTRQKATVTAIDSSRLKSLRDSESR
jgi:8-oxo-dGTP pyrophosphatase MutT (NUDIX family)